MKLWIPFSFWSFFKIVCLERGHGVLGFVIASDRKGVEYIFFDVFWYDYKYWNGFTTKQARIWSINKGYSGIAG